MPFEQNYSGIELNLISEVVFGSQFNAELGEEKKEFCWIKKRRNFEQSYVDMEWRKDKSVLF